MSKAASPKSHSARNAKRAILRAHPRAISRRNRSSLSLFRSLTHSPELRDFHTKRILQREATKGVEAGPFLGFLRAIQQLDDFPQKVCRARKERRQVLFALGKQGGNHKPPRYTINSKVRC